MEGSAVYFCKIQKIEMDVQTKNYLEFLKFCLEPKNAIPFCVESINWTKLLDFAKKQTIVGICWQGIQRLVITDNKPSEDEVMDWMGEYQKIVRRNSKVDKAVASLSLLLKGNDLEFFVLKSEFSINL